MSNSPEKFQSSQDYRVETAVSAAEQLEKVSTEKSAESNQETTNKLVNEAKNEALRTAISIEARDKTEKTTDKSSASRRGPISKKQLNESYKSTIAKVQKELNPGTRMFSRLIHNKIAEKTSETLGNTIARPNVILSGAFSAFILTLLTYVIAKTSGYRLSGSETIIAFATGWIIGAIFEYLKVIITGKK